MTPPGGLGQLTLALGLWLGRPWLRNRGCRLVRFGPDLLAHLEGDPNQMGCALAILDTSGVRFDALKQRPDLVGTEIDFLQTAEQFKALKHGAPLHRHRDEIFGFGPGGLV
jgi:hypothetical protein